MNRHIKSNNNNPYITHIAIDALDGSTWVDVCEYGIWRGWKRLDNFGCNTAADLASLLGVASMKALDNGDADNLTVPGFYQSTNWINTPSGVNYGIIFMPNYADGYWKFQIFFSTSLALMYFRCGTSSGYSAWKQVAIAQ